MRSGLLDGAVVLGVYAPFGSEADPSALFEWQRKSGGVLAFPKVQPQGLEWFIATPETLQPSPPWSINEPSVDSHRSVAPADIGAWIVPGLGFSENGHRIGYGRGYYDRALESAAHHPTIGFAFSAQLIDALPTEPHDRALTAVVTENGLLHVA